MPTPKILEPDFFRRDTLAVAKELLGKFLVKNEKRGETLCFLITEVEAYDGPEDKASHASRGRTPRTEVMFWEGGYFYIYLVYGMHFMLNIVTGDRDYPAAILIRGTREVSGPGRLTKKLGVDKSWDRNRVHPDSGLWVEDRGVKFKSSEITTALRVGVDYADEIWKNKPYRFLASEQD